MVLSAAHHTYLKDVLGVSKLLLPYEQLPSVAPEAQVAVAFVVPEDLSDSAKQLVHKMVKMCPLQPSKVVSVNLLLGANEVESKLQSLTPVKALLFGDSLFRILKGSDENFFDYINQSFPFAEVNVYASHDLEDMCKGPNVNMLKKQVWQQMKHISSKP